MVRDAVLRVMLFGQDYEFGDGTKALVESTKKGLGQLGKSLGIVADFEREVFNVPCGCRRFILRPDSGDVLSISQSLLPYISQLLIASISQMLPPHSRPDDDEHWSVEFQDAEGNVALMLSGHTQMNLLVCNFVHQARAARAS
jgi:hypothetical protein